MKYIMLMFAIILSLMYAALNQSVMAFIMFVMFTLALLVTALKEGFNDTFVPKARKTTKQAKSWDKRHNTQQTASYQSDSTSTSRGAILGAVAGAAVVSQLDEDLMQSTTDEFATDALFDSPTDLTNITSAVDETVVNPATGLLMIGGMGGLDAAGNPYGIDNSLNTHCDVFDSSSLNNCGIDSSFDDSFSSTDGFSSTDSFSDSMSDSFNDTFNDSFSSDDW